MKHEVKGIYIKQNGAYTKCCHKKLFNPQQYLVLYGTTVLQN